MNTRSRSKERGRHSPFLRGSASDAVRKHVGQNVPDARLDDEKGVPKQKDIQREAGHAVHE